MEREFTADEVRVVGALMEKQLATPEYYPLTARALLAACNQTSNRNPVVDYDESTVVDALNSLREKGAVRVVHSPAQRAAKYRHVLDEALGLDRPEAALLCVLMLRGAQTPGELRARTERMHSFEDHAALEAACNWLVERDFVRRLGRQPGQKEARWVHLLGAVADTEPLAEWSRPATTTPTAGPRGDDRITRLEEQVEQLRAEVASLRELLGPD